MGQQVKGINWSKVVSTLIIGIMLVLFAWALNRHFSAPPVIPIPVPVPEPKPDEPDKDHKKHPWRPWKKPGDEN